AFFEREDTNAHYHSNGSPTTAGSALRKQVLARRDGCRGRRYQRRAPENPEIGSLQKRRHFLWNRTAGVPHRHVVRGPGRVDVAGPIFTPSGSWLTRQAADGRWRFAPPRAGRRRRGGTACRRGGKTAAPRRKNGSRWHPE